MPSATIAVSAIINSAASRRCASLLRLGGADEDAISHALCESPPKAQTVSPLFQKLRSVRGQAEPLKTAKDRACAVQTLHRLVDRQ